MQLFEMVVNLARCVHQYLAIQVQPDEVYFVNIEVDMEEAMEEAMEIDEEDLLRTLTISQTWDFWEIDDISGNGVMIQDLMDEDHEVRFDDDLDMYLVMVDQLMEEDVDKRFHFY